MTSAYQVQWAADESHSMTSAEDVVRLIRQLHGEAKHSDALVVAITSPAGDDFTLGIGRDTSVCGWTSASKDPPYFASRGPNKDGPDLVFFYFGEWTDFPAGYGIPIEDAIKAAGEFVARGERPSTIEWQEV